MRGKSLLIRVIAILVSALTVGVGVNFPVAAQSGELLSPCKLDLPPVYLIVDHTRRYIVDWDTFLNLGYTTQDIVPCGDAGQYPEGAPITRLIKGSGDEVYWMENGFRRHILDMATFDSLGFKIQDISLLPDAVVQSWPLGKKLLMMGPASVVKAEVTIGVYTIQLIKENIYAWYALISAPDQPTVKVPYVVEIGTLPAVDITGEGDPDVMFLRNDPILLFGIGTVVYNLGTQPREVLDVTEIYHMSVATGKGEFKDLNDDGIYEFVTEDAFSTYRNECALVTIPVVLQYDPARMFYSSANRQFPDFYAGLLTTDMTKSQCHAVMVLLYLGRNTEAKALFDSLYPGSDPSAWSNLEEHVQAGRYYVPGS